MRRKLGKRQIKIKRGLPTPAMVNPAEGERTGGFAAYVLFVHTGKAEKRERRKSPVRPTSIVYIGSSTYTSMPSKFKSGELFLHKTLGWFGLGELGRLVLLFKSARTLKTNPIDNEHEIFEHFFVRSG
jgi:hypothetical protein